MDNKFKVSVIIPFYKGVDWLVEAVDSVLAQTYSNVEIIVVNDGSTEDLSDFLVKYGNHIIYIYQENRGPGAARNRGIEIAQGDFICFLDSDDLWLPEKLEKQLEFMLKYKYVWSHTGGSYFYTDDRSRMFPFDFSHNSGRVAKRGLVSMQIATPSVMIQSSILHKNSSLCFNEQMRYSQDTFFYQMLAQYYELGYLNDICVLIRLRNMDKNVETINANKQFRIRFTARTISWNLVKLSNNNIFYAIPLYVKSLYMQYAFFEKYLILLEQKKISFSAVEKVAKLLFGYLWLYGRIYLIINDYVFNFDCKKWACRIN